MNIGCWNGIILVLRKKGGIELKKNCDCFVLDGSFINIILSVFFVMTIIIFAIYIIQMFANKKYVNCEKWFSVLKAVASILLIVFAICYNFETNQVRWFKVPDMTLASALAIVLAIIEIASALAHILQPETKEERLKKLEQEVTYLRELCDEIESNQVMDMIKLEKQQKKSYDVTVKIIK